MSRISTWMNWQGCVFLSPLKCSSRYISLLLGIARGWQKQSNYSDISRILNDILPPFSTDFVSQQKRKENSDCPRTSFVPNVAWHSWKYLASQMSVYMSAQKVFLLLNLTSIIPDNVHNSIPLEVLEHVGLARILEIRRLFIYSISSFHLPYFARRHNSILVKVLERVGLAGILGIMGALYRQPARITYAGLRSAWCNGREIRQTFGISLSWYPGILGNI